MIVNLLAWLLGGLGIFLLGMDFSSKGLRRLAGDGMKSVLSKLTSNRMLGLFVGIVSTAVLQSSSASTVMLVGFVEATAMTLSQAIGVILGAKIGTTLTVQIIAFDLSQYALFLVAAGYLLRVLSKGKTLRSTGNIVMGFGLIFFGMGMISHAMAPLRDVKWFTQMLVSLGRNPLYGVLLAAAFTSIVQSSAATIGLAIALAANGLVTLDIALPIAWGAHIGTSATALLASIGTGRAGKQVAVAHLIISILGVVIAFPFLGFFIDGAVAMTTAQGTASVARELANGHMIFTIITSLFLLLFVKPVVWATKRLIPVGEPMPDFAPVYLNSASLDIPEMAVELAGREIGRLFSIVRDMFGQSMEMLEHPQFSSVVAMESEDDKVDILEKAIRIYLTGIAQEQVTPEINSKAHAYIYIVQELESIGDLITKEIAHASKKLDKHDINFSPEGLVELQTYHGQVLKKYDQVLLCVKDFDRKKAHEIIDSTENDRQMERTLRWNHIERLHQGHNATVATSAWHLSVLLNLRAISEKLDDIATIILDEI